MTHDDDIDPDLLRARCEPLERHMALSCRWLIATLGPARFHELAAAVFTKTDRDVIRLTRECVDGIEKEQRQAALAHLLRVAIFSARLYAVRRHVAGQTTGEEAAALQAWIGHGEIGPIDRGGVN